ncbi:phage minor head protein [Raoultella ornithinolytica]|uniref:phage minor head protein n=1 Tax=Raoultella ornithinolytica TaxID=54291 RepID=UPI00300D4D51
METANDKLSDESLAHAIWVSQYSTGVANRMIKILNDSDAELTARLLVAMATLDAESFTVSRLESLLVSVRALNHEAVQSMHAGLSAELQELAQHEAGFQLSLFQFAIPDDVLALHPLVGISPDAVYAAAMARPFQGRLLSEWASSLESDRMARISNTVRQGFLLGDTHEQIARKVRGHANRGYQDGALQMSRTNAGSVAKTAVGHLAATARTSFADANDDILKGKQWLSTLDNKTSKDCRIRDRLKYTMDNKPIGHKVPYLQGPGKIHFCCRSVETYILKSSEELGIKVGEVKDSSRASMDGQVPADTTYQEWFSRQSFSRQSEIVGITRARLIRDGDMSPDEFYNDRGVWLTLDQLRERDGQAFRDAGL